MRNLTAYFLPMCMAQDCLTQYTRQQSAKYRQICSVAAQNSLLGLTFKRPAESILRDSPTAFLWRWKKLYIYPKQIQIYKINVWLLQLIKLLKHQLSPLETQLLTCTHWEVRTASLEMLMESVSLIRLLW